jgi:hypothetical protein
MKHMICKNKNWFGDFWVIVFYTKSGASGFFKCTEQYCTAKDAWLRAKSLWNIKPEIRVRAEKRTKFSFTWKEREWFEGEPTGSFMHQSCIITFDEKGKVYDLTGQKLVAETFDEYMS